MTKETKKVGAKKKDYMQRKHPVTVYISGRDIDAHKGLEKCKEICLLALAIKYNHAALNSVKK